MKEFLKHTHIFIIEMLLAFLIKLSSYKFISENESNLQDTIFIIASVIIITIYVIQCVNIFYPKITEWLNKNNSNNNQ